MWAPCVVLRRAVVLDRLHSGQFHSICGVALWQLRHRLQNLRLEASSRRRRQGRQGQPPGIEHFSRVKVYHTGPYILILLSYLIACPLVVYRSRALKPRTSVGTDTFHSLGMRTLA